MSLSGSPRESVVDCSSFSPLKNSMNLNTLAITSVSVSLPQIRSRCSCRSTFMSKTFVKGRLFLMTLMSTNESTPPYISKIGVLMLVFVGNLGILYGLVKELNMSSCSSNIWNFCALRIWNQCTMDFTLVVE